MTSKTKLSYSECKVELQRLSDASYAKYGSHSYAAGYFESMLAEVLAELPKATQARLIESVRTASVMQSN